MRQLGGCWPCWAALLLGYLPPAAAADLPAPPLTALAHSALVTLDGAATPGGLILRVRHSAAGAPLAVTELSVSLEGRAQVAVRRADGSWFVAVAPAAWRPNSALEVIVAHDGVREILDAHIGPPQPAAPARGAADLLHDHKQLAWWILNITIVLIAVIAISRRMS
jgi:hypothetical protein